jgi:hypothetical protein
MSKQPSRNANLGASAFTASVAAKAQASVISSTPASSGRKGTYQYIPGITGLNFSSFTFLNGLTPKQIQAVAELVARYVSELGVGISTNSAVVSSFLVQLAAILALQDASSPVLLAYLTALVSGNSISGATVSGGVSLSGGTTISGGGTYIGYTVVPTTVSGGTTVVGAAPPALEKFSGVTVGYAQASIPVDPITKVPRYPAQFFATDIVTDYATGQALYLSDERNSMIRRIIPGDTYPVGSGLLYPVVQTLARNQQPRSIKFDTVNKFVYSSLTSDNSFYLYYPGGNKGYSVRGERTTVSGSSAYLDVMGVDNVGNMYYLQYRGGDPSPDSNLSYIYRYNPLTNTHTLLTNPSATGSAILKSSSEANISGALSTFSLWSQQLVFSKSLAYAILIPDTLVTFSLSGGAITPSSTVTVLKPGGMTLGTANIQYIAAEGNSPSYLYYYRYDTNNIRRTASSDNYASSADIFNSTPGYSGNNGLVSSARVNLTGATGGASPSFSFDISGNMFLSDIGNTVIRKLTPASGTGPINGSATITYVAGTNTSWAYNGDTLPYKATLTG